VRALILAAGRGERLRPLTDVTPKPLLSAGGKRLIEWQIEALVRAGVTDLVINIAHLAAAFEPALGNGARYGARIVYSREGDDADAALETRGGIVKALPLLGTGPFIAVGGDIVTDFDYRRLAGATHAIHAGTIDAHLVLTTNPPYHPHGDMGLVDGLITRAPPWFTYASIGVFAPRLFADEAAVKTKLFPWLYAFADQERVSGEFFRGRWHNVGALDDLAALDRELRESKVKGEG